MNFPKDLKGRIIKSNFKKLIEYLIKCLNVRIIVSSKSQKFEYLLKQKAKDNYFKYLQSS